MIPGISKIDNDKTGDRECVIILQTNPTKDKTKENNKKEGILFFSVLRRRLEELSSFPVLAKKTRGIR